MHFGRAGTCGKTMSEAVRMIVLRAFLGLDESFFVKSQLELDHPENFPPSSPFFLDFSCPSRDAGTLIAS